MPSPVDIVVISLRSASSRRERVVANLNTPTSGEAKNWRFFDALHRDAEVFDLRANEDRQIARYGRKLGPSEIGCFKSHYMVLKSFLNDGLSPWLLVLEDDVWLDPHFDIMELLSYAEKRDIHYIRLFGKMYKPAKIVGMLSGFRQVIRFSTDPYGAQVYLISRRGAQAFLKNLTSIDMPIDDELGRFWRHGLLPIAVFPFPAVETSVESSLQADREGGGMTRVRYSSKLVSFRIFEKLRKIVANMVIVQF